LGGIREGAGQGEEREWGEGGRNDPNIVCAYEYKKKNEMFSYVTKTGSF
jgi:hypothetical protein